MGSILSVLASYGLDKVASLDAAIGVVEKLRGRECRIEDWPLGRGLWGMWIGYPHCDRIIVNADLATSRLHREHIIAHELMHVLDAYRDPVNGGFCACRTQFDNPVERRVEEMASHLMLGIRQSRGLGGRVDAMFFGRW